MRATVARSTIAGSPVTRASMFSISLHRAEHVRRYSIRATASSGWEVRTEEDRRLTRSVQYRDWHRVERALAMFHSEVAELMEHGWEVRSGP
jgi:hypothetical protein